jgi:hypothetical protein
LQVDGSVTVGNAGKGVWNNDGGVTVLGGGLNTGVRGEYNQVATSLNVPGDSVNNGFMRFTESTVNFAGTFTNNGVLQTDPSTLSFATLSVGPSGVINAQGDTYNVSGDFLNKSTMKDAWDTTQASLIFSGNPDAGHTFELAGTEFGFDRAGYTSNFAWGTLDVTGVNALKLADGNLATPTAALYTGVELGVQFAGADVSNIFGNGFNIYYDQTLTGNAYLSSATYNLNNGGQLRPVGVVPEPISMLLFAIGGGVLAVSRKRRKS